MCFQVKPQVKVSPRQSNADHRQSASHDYSTEQGIGSLVFSPAGHGRIKVQFPEVYEARRTI